MSGNSQTSYTVVARRYRPQTFRDLVGQGHIVTALSNAIQQHRVGHAYLFTGARGTGKTSSARIFAKCLNCESGPTPQPCNQCDICQAIASGEDVDVLEIDGASNRGIDEIRQLRSNVNIRPSRSRFKIYIIDEVHMLTKEAFNALLKTLEEPPEHVKFLFCTTDPQKLPITVLSRCQRFDFVPVAAGEITQRLREIAVGEGVEADEAALQLIARRAAGSMRDSQSLLEQVFSFCQQKITLADVHSLLGTADSGKIFMLATAMLERRAADALQCIQEFISEGCDAGQLANQLVGFFRDLMVFRVGADPSLLLSVDQSDQERLSKLAQQAGLDTLLSSLQILDQTLVRMQSSMHARVLLEAAVLRVCELENLQSVVDLMKQLQGSGTESVTRPPAAAVASAGNRTAAAAPTADPKKKAELNPAAKPVSSVNTIADNGSSQPSRVAAVSEPNTPPAAVAGSNPSHLAGSESNAGGPVRSAFAESVPAQSPVAVSPVAVKSPEPKINSQSTSQANGGGLVSNPEVLWRRTLAELGDFTADVAADFRKVESLEADSLTVTLGGEYQVQLCNRAERRQRVEDCLARIAGRRIRIDYVAAPTARAAVRRQEPVNRRQIIRRLEQQPFVKSVIGLFDGEVTDFELPRNFPDSAEGDTAPPDFPRE